MEMLLLLMYPDCLQFHQDAPYRLLLLLQEIPLLFPAPPAAVLDHAHHHTAALLQDVSHHQQQLPPHLVAMAAAAITPRPYHHLHPLSANSAHQHLQLLLVEMGRQAPTLLGCPPLHALEAACSAPSDSAAAGVVVLWP
jgi:hypothetical protein